MKTNKIADYLKSHYNNNIKTPVRALMFGEEITFIAEKILLQELKAKCFTQKDLMFEINDRLKEYK